jgi:putative phage-type endonuclease
MDEKIWESPACTVEGRTDTLSEDGFRGIRVSGFGGSDAGALMGLSKYATPMTVVAGKLGLVKGFEGNAATKRGKRLEPAIKAFLAQWYLEDMGVEIQIFNSPFLYRSVKYPWMIANIDGLVLHPQYGWCVLEIKTANERQEEHWEDDSVPDSYYAQGQHYNSVLGLPMTIYAAFVGLDLHIRHVPASEEFQTRMIETERVMWHDYVLNGLLPAPLGNDAEDDVLAQVYSDPSDESVNLYEYQEQAARHVFLNSVIKEMDAEKKKIASEIKAAIGNAKYGIIPGYKASWSRFTTSRFDKDRFGKEHPDLLSEYTSEEPSGRFTITAAK